MCGILAFYNIKYRKSDIFKAFSFLTHRGPDDEGYLIENDIGILHKRLSIIDLTGGREPIFSEDKRFVLVFNGEVYNYKELRDGLKKEGHSFSTNTDCEVIVHLAEDYEPSEYINKLNGDFAFVVYDRFRKLFTVVRDRFGIRPMYYSKHNDGYLFSSDLKPIFFLRENNELNLQSVNTFLKIRYCPSDLTMINGIMKLPAGCYMKIDGLSMEIKQYWKPDYTDQQITYNDAVDRFHELFLDAVKLRLQADVPVGIFLSGGVDSSAVLGAVSCEGIKIHSYSVGFEDMVDEVKNAEDVANRYGTEHKSFILKKDSYKRLSQIIRYFANPVGDMIILPTYYLAEHSKRDVKVVLTGEGADEYLGGYIHHKAIYYGEVLKRYVPKSFLKIFPEPLFRGIMPYVDKPDKGLKSRVIDFYEAKGLEKEYISFASVFNPTDNILNYDVNIHLNGVDEYLKGFDAIIEMDRLNWLEAYTLNKQDSLLMANSLEGRVPFLDHRLYEFAVSLPVKYKISPFKTKKVFRDAVKGIIPEAYASRKKKAFYIPARRVFDSNFELYVRDIISTDKLREIGIFNVQNTLSIVDKYFTSPDMVVEKQLVCLLIFCLWYQEIYKGGFIVNT